MVLFCELSFLFILFSAARNGVYVNVVESVKEAFMTEEVVRLDCTHVGTSDCKRIGAKLRVWLVNDFKYSFLNFYSIFMFYNLCVFHIPRTLYLAFPFCSKTSRSYCGGGNKIMNKTPKFSDKS